MESARTKVQSYPIRYCTGGCSSGSHESHLYNVDPFDGPLNATHICPGNAGRKVMEELDEEGEGTLWGFFAPPAPNARFWLWENGWVKLTLRPGQSLTMRKYSRDEEGFSRRIERWSHEGTHVLRQTGFNGSDCDGRISGGGDDVCPLSRLQAVPPYRSHPDEFAPAGRPDWQPIKAWQRDEAAELAGY